MKRIKLSSLIAACLLAVAFVSCSGGNDGSQQAAAVQPAPAAPAAPAAPEAASAPTAAAPVAMPALPEPVNAFLQQHFPGKTVAMVETDSEYAGVEFEVTLNDGTEVNFRPNNDWDKVECRASAVPAALVPATIAKYVKANFQAVPIVKIDREAFGYDIELGNGVELKFNPNGQFMGYDD